MSDQVSPRNGSLGAIKRLSDSIRDMYNYYYAVTGNENTPAEAMEKYMGDNIIHFGRAPGEYQINPAQKGTSGYVMIPCPYTYSGYSTEFQYNLQDGYDFETSVNTNEDSENVGRVTVRVYGTDGTPERDGYVRTTEDIRQL